MSAATGALDVAVNLLWVAPGRVGGSEEYLVRQFVDLTDGDLSLELHCTAAFAAAHPELRDRHRLVVAPGGWDNRAGRIAAEHSWLTWHSRGADVVHHGGGTSPLVGRRPIVLTVHDLQYRTHPDYFGRARLAYLDAMMPRSVRRASIVAVPTAFVGDTVVEAFGVDPSVVAVVPHGVPDVAPASEIEAVAVRERYRLGDVPFVVYPAITHPHKGHRVLVDAAAHLRDLHVVLIGGEGPAEPALAEAIASSPARARIHRLGRVPSRDRDVLIASAEALAFPSEYEGFGAPLVEAMAAGTPVVAGDAAAVAEVVGPAAVVVTERTGAAWADAIESARRRRDELVAAGADRRRRFTSAASAAAIADAYRRAAGRR